MDCLAVWQIQLDTGQEIYLENGTANEACETQQQGKMDFLMQRISSVVPLPQWHSACLVMDVSVPQPHPLKSSFCHCGCASRTRLDGNTVLSTTQGHCHLKHGLGEKPTQHNKAISLTLRSDFWARPWFQQMFCWVTFTSKC